MNKKIISIVVLSFFLSACGAVATDYTARSLGVGKWGASGGAVFAGQVGPYVTVARGVTDNFDLGVAAEDEFANGAVGVTAKYAFINNPDKFSAAMNAGAGYSFGCDTKGVYGNIGPIVSYKFGKLEPFAAARITGVSGGLVYGQFTLGNNIWFTDKLGLNASVSAIVGGSGGVAGSAGLSYRF